MKLEIPERECQVCGCLFKPHAIAQTVCLKCTRLGLKDNGSNINPIGD